MVCTDEHKVLFRTHVLSEEAEYWWEITCQRLEFVGTVVTWENYKIDFLEKYFPTDVRSKKEIEFLQLKQGSMIVAKFEELVRLGPQNNSAEVEGSTCVKFESGLNPEIK